jgi:hypothetical protein
MSTNPLQKYFRQPKIFIKLPSGGIYSKPGTIQGDVTHMPVYGMTGMDEIMMRTPDALLTGESTANVIASCCPNIKEAWDVSVTDILMIITAIRISTYGNTMHVKSNCTECSAENDYEMDLNQVIEHYMNCRYENTIVLDQMIIKTQPLTYKRSTELNVKNFQLQQQMTQALSLEDSEEKQKQYQEIFKAISDLQLEILKASIESVEVDGQIVTERSFIADWLGNCDKSVIDSIKDLNQRNTDTWSVPEFRVECDSCNAENKVRVELDESNFFVKA